MNLTSDTSPHTETCEDLIRQLESLRSWIEQQAESGKQALIELPPERNPSGENLLNYLALRSWDLRSLQDGLARLGLSSLGRLEAHVLATINAVLHNLYLLSGQEPVGGNKQDIYSAYTASADLLDLNTISLFGQYPEKRHTHIMVTMPMAAADDYLLVQQLLESGMNCMRINCAQGNPPIWVRMIEHLRKAERETGNSCRVLMDLGGSKLRLGSMEPIPSVLKVKPVRASNGQVLHPARIWLAPAQEVLPGRTTADASLVLDPDWLADVTTGDRIRFRDARGSRRNWRIREVTSKGCWAESKKTAYVVNGTIFHLNNKQTNQDRQTEITSLEAQNSICHIRPGDSLLVSADDTPGKPEVYDDKGVWLGPANISLTIPEVYRDVQQGEPIFFDDGRIGGVIEKCGAQQLSVRITHTRKPVEKLEGNRGVNLPDTRLDLPALGTKDLKDLEFAVRHADIVGMSFVNSPDDVRLLHQNLQELGREDIGVVLKIETKRGFSNLPGMLLEALKFPTCGFMIARGDLAVECGFERLSEVQEEILWVCESAHVPVIWATQVLEGLTRHGHATRAEITDAAMAQAAEAVMLNKGSHIIEAVEMLDDILQRMQGHHHKKRSILRKLQLASAFHLSDKQV